MNQEDLEKDEEVHEALREISILKKLKHENIIKLNEILHDEDSNIYLSIKFFRINFI